MIKKNTANEVVIEKNTEGGKKQKLNKKSA